MSSHVPLIGVAACDLRNEIYLFIYLFIANFKHKWTITSRPSETLRESRKKCNLSRRLAREPCGSVRQILHNTAILFESERFRHPNYRDGGDLNTTM